MKHWLGISLLAACSVCVQAAEPAYDFSIPAKPLPQALSDFSRVTGQSVVYTQDTPYGLEAPALKGTFTAEQALRQLLSHSGLNFRRAIENTGITPDFIQIDGNDLPQGLPCPAEAIIKGDGKIAEISAASIVAKNARDRLMVELDETYPGYGFAKHKGYGVKAHSEALATLGPCAVHRMSFKPVSLSARRLA